MRYDTPVIFRKKRRDFDYSTGNYTETVTSDTIVYASVDGTRSQMMTLVYGGAVQDSITVQLQNHYEDTFYEILVHGMPYKVDYRDPKRVKDIFVLRRV